jgi:hypothetical protein
MKIDNFAVVCRVDDCHGRIKPRDPKYPSRGVCEKCGTDTDEWERANRPEDWKARQRIILQEMEALRDATCDHVKITIGE